MEMELMAPSYLPSGINGTGKSPSPDDIVNSLSAQLDALRKLAAKQGRDLDPQMTRIIERMVDDLDRAQKAKRGNGSTPGNGVKNGNGGNGKPNGHSNGHSNGDNIRVGGKVQPGGVAGNGSAHMKNAAGRDIIEGTVITHADNVNFNTPEDPEKKRKTEEAAAMLGEAERDYLISLQEAASRVALGKLDLQMAMPSDETPDIGLADIYVPLNIARTQRALKDDNAPPARVPVPVLDTVNRTRCLVILGDPGSGKTTFLNHVTWCLAGARLNPGKSVYLDGLSAPQQNRQPAVNWSHDALLPVRVELREFAQAIPAKTRRGTSKLLMNYIVQRLKEQNFDSFADEVRKALRTGQAMVMLDGLDEIIDLEKRQIVCSAVSEFAYAHPKARFIVTCRVLSYTDPGWQLDGFPSVTLAPLSETSIKLFISKWYNASERRMYIPAEVAKAKAQQLSEAAENLRDLAKNPMLLTVMCVIHTYRGMLPRERARLYEDCVQLLLLEWEQARQVGMGGWQQGIVEELGTRKERLMSGLCEVAFKVHSDENDSPSASNIAEGDVLRVLQKYLDNDWNKAKRFCEYVEKRAGLLIGKGQDKGGEAMYAFPHRGFQEFLAARYLVLDRDFPRTAARLAAEGDVWREVLLLAIGHLVYNQEDVYRPLSVINVLVKPEPPEPGDTAGWRAVWWAGEMMVIVGKQAAEGDEHVGKHALPRLHKQLTQLVTTGRLTPVERAQAADALGALGDTRPGVCTLEPETVAIPGGTFKMGQKNEQHKVTVRPFRFATFPVTNAQFERFARSDGYKNDLYWTEAGREWRDRAAKRGGLLEHPSFGAPNRPVVAVTWHEAVAYCNWLRRRTGKKYRLLTEAEWERAAGGTDGRRYPFGDKASDDYLNTREAGVGETSAVGIFPRDRTPEGVYDMGGNVWEWTSSLDKGYPYKESDGREKLEAAGARVLRGGSHDNDRNGSHCTQRRPVEPHACVRMIGFRLALDES
jgi:formylglycine-generating enzyme required for sulfatase activity